MNQNVWKDSWSHRTGEQVGNTRRERMRRANRMAQEKEWGPAVGGPDPGAAVVEVGGNEEGRA